MKRYTIIICQLVAFLVAQAIPYDLHGQTYPYPALPDTSALGRYTSRTLSLLNNSSTQRSDVKILVYGQSISEQKWWLEVKRFVESKFPQAHITMENKAIGGFSTQYLYKTVEMDVSSFYPDLVLLHVYGNQAYYDSVLFTIRSRTTAEIGIMTDHYIGENKWSDTMSYYILPALAEKYKCDIINIRDPWKKYLSDNKLETAALLSDGTHLNDYGNYLMAELVKPIFCCKSKWTSDSYNLERTYKAGIDLNFLGDTLVLPFIGNRVDLIIGESYTVPADSATVLIDGRAPSSFQSTFYVTRPFNEKGDAWPWKLPAMIRIRHNKPWVNEVWSCVFTEVKPPYTDFSFKISGSVSGADGTGKGSMDFVSKSGRVIIGKDDGEDGGDWHLKRSYKVLKTLVNKGDTVKWKTYSISKDSFAAEFNENSASDNTITLVQGITNTSHIMKIVKHGDRPFPVSAIKVYYPYWGR